MSPVTVKNNVLACDVTTGRTDVVSVMVYIESDNEPSMNLSGKSPGSTPLSDYVRRKVQRKLGLRLTHHDRRMILRMVRSAEDCNWTSPVEDFKV